MLPLKSGKAVQVEQEPGILCVAYILRPDSRGSIHLTSTDPDAPLDIDPNYFATEHDRTTAVGVFRGMRRLFATGALAKRIERETVPGPAVQADQEIIDAPEGQNWPDEQAGCHICESLLCQRCERALVRRAQGDHSVDPLNGVCGVVGDVCPRHNSPSAVAQERDLLASERADE